MLVPLAYNVRSIFVRRSATVLTLLGIGATVTVLTGFLALSAGFRAVYTQGGRSDVVYFLRSGATSEGQSSFPRERADRLVKSTPEIAPDAKGAPLAAMEIYNAVRRQKARGAGETNVPIRGVQPASFELRENFRVVAGRAFKFGSDEVMVGTKLVDRIQGCGLDDVIQLNTTPFRVVGVFESAGAAPSEIWGDYERIGVALAVPWANSILARLKPGVNMKEFARRIKDDKENPCKVMTEPEYLEAQTNALGTMLAMVGVILGVVMGVAAIFTAMNTMLAALAARTHEIGILLSVGFRPFAIFVSFLFEALLLGLLGGAIGCLLALPLNGIETGTTNWDTFTEIAFSFRLTPQVLVTAVIFSLALGLFGGAIPAFRAARLAPTEALRRR
jgi:putative ABC transport system permease protein